MTWIFLWDSAPSKIFIGDTQVSKVFMWDTQVRPTWWGGWWTPWVNTIWYYTMDNDIINQALSQYATFPDGTLNTATFSTTQTHWNNTYSLYCDGSTYAYLPASSEFEFGTNDFTISCWVYSETNSWTYAWFISNSMWPYPDSNKAYRISDRFNGSNSYNFCWDWDDLRQNISTWISMYNTWWHNCIITRVSGIFHIYLDGNELATITIRTDKGIWVNGNIAFWYNLIDSTYSRVYLNDVIFENRWWSAQDVSDYYQATA